jgi:hypothetical protein
MAGIPGSHHSSDQHTRQRKVEQRVVVLDCIKLRGNVVLARPFNSVVIGIKSSKQKRCTWRAVLLLLLPQPQPLPLPTPYLYLELPCIFHDQASAFKLDAESCT